MQGNKLLMAPIAALICIATAPALANPQSMDFGSATLSFNGSVVMDRGTDVARLINLEILPKGNWTGGKVQCEVQHNQLTASEIPSEADLKRNENIVRAALDANPSPMKTGSTASDFSFYPYFASVDLDYSLRGSLDYEHTFRKVRLIRNKDRANGDPVFNLYTMHCYGFTSNLADSMKKAIESQAGLSLPPVRSDAERRAP